MYHKAGTVRGGRGNWQTCPRKPLIVSLKEFLFTKLPSGHKHRMSGAPRCLCLPWVNFWVKFPRQGDCHNTVRAALNTDLLQGFFFSLFRHTRKKKEERKKTDPKTHLRAPASWREGSVPVRPWLKRRGSGAPLANTH